MSLLHFAFLALLGHHSHLLSGSCLSLEGLSSRCCYWSFAAARPEGQLPGNGLAFCSSSILIALSPFAWFLGIPRCWWLEVQSVVLVTVGGPRFLAAKSKKIMYMLDGRFWPVDLLCSGQMKVGEPNIGEHARWHYFALVTTQTLR
jgi:hypothetical protein